MESIITLLLIELLDWVMSNGTELPDFVDQFFKSLRAHPWISLLLIIGLVLYTGITATAKVMKDWEYIYYRIFPKKGEIAQVQADALKLSEDLSEFLRVRQLDEPQILYDDWENSTNRMIQYSQETMNLYYRDYAPRVADIRQEFIERGITDEEFDRLYEYPTNQLGLQALALKIVELSLTLEET